MSHFPVSPLSLDCLTRDVYGSFDASIIAQLAPLAENDCYQPKVYRAPAVGDELFAANEYRSFGLKITPGSLFYAFSLPISPITNLPGQFNVQVTDASTKESLWDQPVPSYMLANSRPTYLSASENVMGASPSFLDAPLPVVGNGLFMVELWETSGEAQRIELVFLVLEPKGEACL
jgi:hypothetical protein